MRRDVRLKGDQRRQRPLSLDRPRVSTYNASMSEPQPTPIDASPVQEPPLNDGQTPEASKKQIALTASTIASRLGETEAAPYALIRRAVKILGTDQALAFLDEALSIEAGEGLMLPDGSRRRTPGGVFFFLIRTRMPKQVRGRIFLTPPKSEKGTPSPTLGASTPGHLVFTWDDRIAALDEIGTEKGRASTVKITVIGTPGNVRDRGTCIVLSMQHTGENLPALPKGVPVPPKQITTYTVYIGAKQWKNVAAAANDPDDMLIVEGFPQIDSMTASIAVFASNVTSKKLQQAKRTAE